MGPVGLLVIVMLFAALLMPGIVVAIEAINAAKCNGGTTKRSLQVAASARPRECNSTDASMVSTRTKESK